MAQDQNPKFVRVNSMFNVFEVFICVHSKKAVPQMHSFGFLKKYLQPDAIPITRFYIHIYKTQGKTTMAYLLLLIRTSNASMFSPDVCHRKLLEIVHREEVNVS